eukprot:gene886-515_t
MLSQNVAKMTVPSYYMIRTNLPMRKPQNQWEGVYYFSGLTKRQRHVLLLQRKRERMYALQAFDKQQKQLRNTWENVHIDPSSSAQDLMSSAAVPAARLAEDPQQRPLLFRLACQLADCGLHQEAIQAMQYIEAAGAAAGLQQLHSGHYSTLLQHLAAPRLGHCLLESDAMGDPALPFKLLGDRGGEERAMEAYALFETGLAQLADGGQQGVDAPSAMCSSAATQLVNSLMEVLLTCGYRHVKAIPNAVYDRMGELGIAPTATTYEHVLYALALIGDMRSAEDIHTFLGRHHHQQRGIRGYDALLLGYREAKAFDQCDRVWEELVDRRWPRAAVSTAELYLRSIMDHAATPVSYPLQRFGDLNVVEKKKVPVILSQLDTLGIPRSHLSRPLQDEVEDALRKYNLYRDRFYEWGRAVKQFDFIEFRRRQGWMYDLDLMRGPTHTVPPVRDPTVPDASLVNAATAELPAFFSERYAWEREPLEDLLFVSETKERTDDVRSGDIYYDERRSIQERSATWMNEVPQTRYDGLYGISQPDVSKIGIRRHLEGEYTNREALLQKDAALMRKTLTRGRRLRHRAEVFRTHRSEATSVPPSAGVVTCAAPQRTLPFWNAGHLITLFTFIKCSLSFPFGLAISFLLSPSLSGLIEFIYLFIYLFICASASKVQANLVLLDLAHFYSPF